MANPRLSWYKIRNCFLYFQNFELKFKIISICAHRPTFFHLAFPTLFVKALSLESLYPRCELYSHIGSWLKIIY